MSTPRSADHNRHFLAPNHHHGWDCETRRIVAAESASGLGCVKTQRRCDDVEWAFRQVSFLVVEASCAWSVAIDFGKLFSSSFNFSSSYTARVKLGSEGSETRLPLYPRDQTSPTRPAMSVSCQQRKSDARTPQRKTLRVSMRGSRCSKVKQPATKRQSTTQAPQP